MKRVGKDAQLMRREVELAKRKVAVVRKHLTKAKLSSQSSYLPSLVNPSYSLHFLFI